MTLTRNSGHVILVGAGLAGSLLAVYLAKRGFRIDMYERRPDMRRTRISAGRSINLALSVRGIHALREVGLYAGIEPILIPMRGRMLHSVAGEQTFSPYGQREHEVINSVSRAELNMRLMDLAEEHDNVRIHFNTRCTGIDLSTGTVLFRNEGTGGDFTAAADTVIGTDGSASAIRLEMQQRGRFNYSQSYLEHGYKELAIPPDAQGGFRLDHNALHIWPRGSYMLIALPNTDRSFTCTLFLPFAGETGFDALATPGAARVFFARDFPDALAMMPTFESDWAANPASALVTVRSAPWHAGGTAALLGDAAHAIVPFFGQGMNCAFEDCSALAACVDVHGADWSRVYAEYEERRRDNANAIADLALENFVEMRDTVADPRFPLLKEANLTLERRHPGHFIPKYSMVSFHRIPYAVALERGRIQDRILDEVTADARSVADIDWARADRLVTTLLPPFPATTL